MFWCGTVLLLLALWGLRAWYYYDKRQHATRTPETRRDYVTRRSEWS